LQNAFPSVDTVDTITTFGQRVPAKRFSQHEAGIDHFNDHPALRRV
jgi:hypothetical protein